MNLVIKDAVWQIAGRVASAIGGFIVIKLITPYLGPLRFGDYSTILKFFAIWSAFADFGLYVIALRQLGSIKHTTTDKKTLGIQYGKFVSTRMFMIASIYTLALVVAYLIPAYTNNPYLVRGLPLGMLFSASFMTAGILQIPLQLYWKMEQLSIGLILARIVQIAILLFVIYVLFSNPDFSQATGVLPFQLIIFSVLMSGIVQGIYVRRKSEKYLPLQRQRDRSFTKHIIGSNRQYGIAYYLSSFHTLIVLILLSIFYPTAQGWHYAGTWALALALIEILLVVPSALGNSLIHKVADADTVSKQKSFGALMSLVVWIGCLVIVGFVRFAPHVIAFIGGTEYLSTPGTRGSDYILPFLGLVITLSFIKQVFNYIFVSIHLQNKLLSINLIGVIIGCSIGIPLVRHYNILGGIVMQITLELVFVLGALWVAWKKNVLPHIMWKGLGVTCMVTLILVSIKYISSISFSGDNRRWLIGGICLVCGRTTISFPWLRRVLKKL